MNAINSSTEREYVELTKEKEDEILSLLKRVLGDKYSHPNTQKFFKAWMKSLGQEFYIQEEDFTDNYKKLIFSVAQQLTPQDGFEQLPAGAPISFKTTNNNIIAVSNNKISFEGNKAKIDDLFKMAILASRDEDMMTEGVGLQGSLYERAMLELSLRHINNLRGGADIKIKNPLSNKEISNPDARKAYEDFQNYINQNTQEPKIVVKPAVTAPAKAWSAAAFAAPANTVLPSSKVNTKVAMLGSVAVAAFALVMGTSSIKSDPKSDQELADNKPTTLFEQKPAPYNIVSEKQILLNPLESEKIGSKFGLRLHPIKHVFKHHEGQDYPAPTGAPIAASADGIVITAVDKVKNAAGKYIEIDHGNDLVTRYLHASKLNVKVGDRVIQGQEIALVGRTGGATGPHLHFEIIKDGKAQNPLTFASYNQKVAAATVLGNPNYASNSLSDLYKAVEVAMRESKLNFPSKEASKASQKYDVTTAHGAAGFVIDELEKGGDRVYPDTDGSLTKYGFNSKYHPDINFNNFTKQDAIARAKEMYWDPLKVGKMPPDMRLAAFDTAFNRGVSKANKLLSAMKTNEPGELISLREDDYRKAAKGNSDYPLKGMINRLVKLSSVIFKEDYAGLRTTPKNSDGKHSPPMAAPS